MERRKRKGWVGEALQTPSHGSDGTCELVTVLAPPFTMAFQPIVDTADDCRIFAHEALVRGMAGEGAQAVFDGVASQYRLGFDVACRNKAFALASRLKLPGYLSVNCGPEAMIAGCHSLHDICDASERAGFPISRTIFEITEDPIGDVKLLAAVLMEFRRAGIKIAFDDYGAGYAREGLLTLFQPDFLKIDMSLIHRIDGAVTHRIIVRNYLSLCAELDITPIAEGVETLGEMLALRAMGVALMQGYLFARSTVEKLPVVNIPCLES
ncbi:EAL domain-containing protein [Inquilinus limosus]|uniref:EAL domain-containing protein n=1 Tax=Inquilinus limosus TaxID=171674 RepID=UPI003F157CB4